jgi:drug/metabolite transporter (DMT)-like permease
MEKINWYRVVLGGLLAGAVLIVLATVSAALFRGQQELRGAIRSSAESLFLIFVFLLVGILMTGAYAAIRPRFGAGPRTAALAGFAVWLTGVWLSLVAFGLKTLVMGEPYPLPSGPILPCLYLVMMIISTGIGACIYKDQQG